MQSQVEILGKVKGKSVPMVMHHSRNSQQKAWDETLVLALAGMGRLLRSHFAPLVAMPAFQQVGPATKRPTLHTDRPSAPGPAPKPSALLVYSAA